MFETSQVQTHVAAQRRVGLFTVSVVAHTAVIVGVIVATVTSVSFPVKAPNEFSRFNTVMKIELPKPPGVRHAQPAAAAQPQQRAATLPANTAPTQIPDTVQPVAASDVNTDPHGIDGPGSSDAGDPHGVVGGVDVGQPAAPADPAPDVYHPGGEVRPAVVVHRVQPEYPRSALITRLSGTVVLECVIDRDGRVRDARVVRSTFAIFEEPALTALRQWKFAPGMLRGKSVDTYFELTVAFQPR